MPSFSLPIVSVSTPPVHVVDNVESVGGTGDDEDMKIVVTTPTGHVGSHLVPLLLQAGERPTLFCRSADRLDGSMRDLVTVVEGDQSSSADVIRALDGADALYWVSPSTNDDDPLAGYAAVAASLVAALHETKVPHIVFQSSVGAEARQGFGDIDGLGATEAAIDATCDALGLAVTHLRCGYLFTNLEFSAPEIRTGVLNSTFPLDVRLSWVAPEDVAAVAAVRLLSRSWKGRTTQAVHGPEDLTFVEAAAQIGTALGIPVRAEYMSSEIAAEALRAMGSSEERVAALIGMSRGFSDRYFVPEDPRSVLTTTPTRLVGWVASSLPS
jgi:uncharacterized protein YbjT (DUF2867 family)